MTALTAILVLATFVTGFGLAMILLTNLISHKRHYSKTKMMPYESGLPGQELKSTKIPVKYYLTAILFIIFDIEIIFMYPWAVAYTDFLDAGHGVFILAAMGVFVSLFIFGLFWEIKSKALEWD